MQDKTQMECTATEDAKQMPAAENIGTHLSAQRVLHF